MSTWGANGKAAMGMSRRTCGVALVPPRRRQRMAAQAREQKVKTHLHTSSQGCIYHSNCCKPQGCCADVFPHFGPRLRGRSQVQFTTLEIFLCHTAQGCISSRGNRTDDTRRTMKGTLATFMNDSTVHISIAAKEIVQLWFLPALAPLATCLWCLANAAVTSRQRPVISINS